MLHGPGDTGGFAAFCTPFGGHRPLRMRDPDPGGAEPGPLFAELRQSRRDRGSPRHKAQHAFATVADARQVQPVRRRRPARAGPWPPRQQLGKRRHRPPPAGDLEHRPHQHPVHLAHERVGLDPELQNDRRASRQIRGNTSREKRTCSVSVGVNAVKSWTPTNAAAHDDNAETSSRRGHHSARPCSNALRAPRTSTR